MIMACMMVIFKSERPYQNVNGIQDSPYLAEKEVCEAIGSSPLYENNYFVVYGDAYVLPNVNNTYYLSLKPGSLYSNVRTECEEYSPLTNGEFYRVEDTDTIYTFICDGTGAYYIRVYAEDYYHNYVYLGYFTIIGVGSLPY